MRILPYAAFITTTCCFCRGSLSPVRRQTNKLFHHRTDQNSIVVGDFLYIHGGDVITWDGQGDGFQSELTQSNGNITTEPSRFFPICRDGLGARRLVSLLTGLQLCKDTYTLSVDLRSPWTTEDVVLNQISIGEAPTLGYPALWEGPSGDTFFMYNGGITYASALGNLSVPPPNQLWEFTPSGASGTWSQVVDELSSNFSSLARTDYGIYASADDLRFAIGGSIDSYTAPNTSDDYYSLVPGIVVYNTTSQQWYNVSSDVVTYAAYGAAHFVPSYGLGGLIFVFGGGTGSWTTFSYARIYEPSSQTWHYQRVSGDIPAKVESPCVVGVLGNNDTYEVHLYGGRAIPNSQAATVEQAGAIHVLSLPSFNWYRQEDIPDFGRLYPTCHVIGAGKRQMAVVGGLTVYSNSSYDRLDYFGLSPDPWAHGIGVWDLSLMRWRDRYDPVMEAYVTPDAVKARNRQAPYPPEWTEPVIESWFVRKGVGGETEDLSEPENSEPQGEAPRRRSSTNTGAIAGGVVGGVLGLACILCAAFFLIRRRRKTRKDSPEVTEYRRPELEATGSSRTEVDGTPKPASELPGSQRIAQHPPCDERLKPELS